MFKSPFAFVMVATFLGAVVTMLLGVAGLGSPPADDAPGAPPIKSRATKLMALRVGLCALLLFEIIIYITWLRPTP